MSETFEYDVFLSHNQADKPRVRRLAEWLRAAGLRVWLDEWVLQPGDDVYLAIERGLETAHTLVLCLSPAALGSDWVGLERSTTLFRDPSNFGHHFIPLLLADAKSRTPYGVTNMWITETRLSPPSIKCSRVADHKNKERWFL